MAVVTDYTALLSGFYWYPGAPSARGTVLTYSFSQAASDYIVASNPAAAASFQPFSDAVKGFTREALRQWGDASGITFVETTTHVGDITFGYYDLALLGAGGAAATGSYPAPGAFFDNTGALRVYSGDLPSAGDVRLSLRYVSGELPFDDQLYVLVHEIGHALGLKHPHDGTPLLDPSYDSRFLTVMSYNGPRVPGLGPFDFEAIQAIYGTDFAAANPAEWSWDPATETLTARISGNRLFYRGTSAKDVVLSSGDGCAIVTSTGNDIILATGARTEVNAGSGNDVIAVTGVDAIALGEDGDDLLVAKRQRVTFFGGKGNDVAATDVTFARNLGGVGGVGGTGNFRFVYLGTGSDFQNFTDIESIRFADGVFTTATSEFVSNVFLGVAVHAIKERSSGFTSLSFTVVRQLNIGLAETLHWAVTGSGANPASASDFKDGVLPAGSLQFAAGEVARVFIVTIAGDQTVEADEAFAVTVFASNGTENFAQAMVTVTIENDDLPTSSTPVMAAGSDTGNFANDAITSIRTPVLTGTAPAGLTVLLFDTDGVTQIGSGLASSGGVWSIATATLADGKHLITARTKDATGTLGAHSAPLTAIIDTQAVAPTGLGLAPGSDSGVSGTDRITNVTRPTIVGTAEPGAGVAILIADKVVGNLVADSLGAWSFQTPALADGAVTVLATQIDLAGNVSGFSAPLTITIDTIAAPPSAPDLVAGSDSGVSDTDNITRITTPGFSGVADAGASVELLAGDGVTVLASGVAADNGAWLLTTTTPLTHATHMIGVRQTDKAGNKSAVSAALPVIIDTEVAPPSGLALDPSSDLGVSNSDRLTAVTQPVVIGTAEAHAKVTLREETVVLGEATADASGRWSVQTTSLTAGTHSFTASAIDRAGNASDASAPLTITIDTTVPNPPSVPNLLAATDTGISSVDNITASVTQTYIGIADPGGTLILSRDGVPLGSTLVGGEGNWAITVSNNAEGAHAITARLMNAAGNLSSETAALTVVLDRSTPPPSTPDLPALFDSGDVATDNVTRIKNPTLIGTAEPGARVSLISGTTILGAAKADSSGAWSVALPALADGLHLVSAASVDVAGNTSVSTGELRLVIDTTPPAAPSAPNLLNAFDSGRLNIDNVTSHQSLGVNGTADPGSIVTLFAGGVALASAVTSPSGVWWVQTPALAEGKHFLIARARDVAGNIGAKSPALTVVVDVTPPAAPVFSRATASQLAGTGDPNAVIELFDGGAPLGLVPLGLETVRPDGGWILPVALGSGMHALTARITDLAGHTGPVEGMATARIGTAGADTLTGSAGTDLMAGGLGDDLYDVDDATDAVWEAVGEGVDTIRAAVSYSLAEGSVVEFLRANAGATGLTLRGNGLVNTIIGGAGDDVIIGGGRMDTLAGGAGADAFAYLARSDSAMPLAARDLILDFSVSEGDRLDLAAIDADETVAGNQGLAFIGGAAFTSAGQLRFEQQGGKTVVIGEVTGDGIGDFAIRLSGAHTLTAGQFVL
jgi:hypothetical protein